MRISTLLIITFSSVTLCNGGDFNISNTIYGDEAERYQFPYQVSIQEKVYNYKFHHICSGAILKRRWIITTAYCVYNCKYSLRIVAGALTVNEFHSDVRIINVQRVIIHPNYTGGISENDIALLQLKRSLFYSRAVSPIPLPFKNTQDVEGAALITGWNVHSRNLEKLSFKSLFYIIIYILSNDDCTRALMQTGISSQNVLCTEQITKGSYCPGESGNTLNYRGYLIGLSSWGLSPCGVTVYTKVFSFTNFINRNMAIRKRPTNRESLGTTSKIKKKQ